MLAVRLRGVGRYFGPQIEIDGVERPREAWRTLLGIAGFNVDVGADNDIQRTVAAGGEVLRDITLDIERGSVVCLSGASGSGKSVLLQIVAGVIPPTTGSVELHGPVTSLISVGDNLDEWLTADENIRASAAYAAAASATAAAAYLAEVVEFAGLQGFEHVPLRTFSTGMTMRLSVALALCGRPSIVLIDDVLAIGDIAFQQQCVERVRTLKEMGTTLVLAFSDDALVQQLATRVITLGGGRVIGDTPPEQWISRQGSSAADVAWQVAQTLPEADILIVRSLAASARRQGDESYLDLTVALGVRSGGVRCRPSVFVLRDRLVLFRSLYPEYVAVSEASDLTFTVTVPTHILPNGEYAISISIAAQHGTVLHSIKAHHAVALSVRRPAGIDGPSSLLALTFPWEVEPLAAAAVQRAVSTDMTSTPSH
jgi:lipopolysaccharide transport system ATP-binding protein